MPFLSDLKRLDTKSTPPPWSILRSTSEDWPGVHQAMATEASATKALPPAYSDGRFDFAVGQPARYLPARDCRPERPQAQNGLTKALRRGAAFGNDSRNGFVVPGDNDLLAVGDAVQQFPHVGLGLKGGNCIHQD